MNKSESKYFNTAVRMDRAFMELLEKKDFEYITVKEICAQAGVNRSTFYLHYDNIGDLMAESIRLMNEQFLSYFKSQNTSIADILHSDSNEKLILISPKYIVPYLTYVKEHRRLYATAIAKTSALNLGDTYERMFKHIFSPIMERFGIAQDERKYFAEFYIHGIIAIITVWLKNDCEMPIDRLMSIIIKCAMHDDANDSTET